MSGFRVTVDRDRCCGSGRCVLEADDVFDQHDDDGTVRLLRTLPDAARRTAVESAASVCPTGAIRILDR